MGGGMKELVGKVVSNRMQKSIVVAVDRYSRHPRLKKVYRWTKKFMAHDEHDSCNSGDLVRIASSRPLSKNKHWTLAEVLRREPVFETPKERASKEAAAVAAAAAATGTATRAEGA
eukprot:jgi/Chlat1/7259/Chrsp58S09135